jgi:tRNA(fMet)-specific endonuclease VapC
VGVLIDTCVLIQAEREPAALGSRLKAQVRESAFLSVITASELLHGVNLAKTAAIRLKRSAWVEELLRSYPLLPIDLPVARVHSELWGELKLAGTMIGAHDLWIAATCLAYDLVLVSDNQREFARVPGLKVI